VSQAGAATLENAAPRMSVRGIKKTFGSIQALRGVDLDLWPGECLGLVGDNAAGKSTLTKILAGTYIPDQGTISLDGEPIELTGPDQARARHIEMVYQDLSLCDSIDVAGNLHLGREIRRGPFLDQKAMQREARRMLQTLEIRIPNLSANVAQLSGGQRQAIAIARAVYSQARILLLDEPLAAMGAKEGALILDLIRNLKERGEVSMILIAHNYAQVLDVCDRVNLLRHGTIFMDKRTSETSLDELTDVMVEEYRRSRRST
jgi:simple sugar transport system ATP-binding protein